MMQSDSVTYQTLDAEHYIRELAKISNPAAKPSEQRITYTFSEQVNRDWHPGRRFVARYLDLILLSALLLFLQVTAFRKGLGATIFNPFSFLVMLMLIPVEAVCYRLFAATPGKWAMGITVDSSDGCKHSMRSAFSRAWSVYRYGMGYGIPIWLLYRHYTSYRDSNQNLESRWDDESELSFKHFNWRRYAAVGLLIALCISMYSFSFYIAKQPLYQNTDVNLKQFTDIYNYYWELNGGEDSWGLNDDGTFKKKSMIPTSSTQTAIRAFMTSSIKWKMIMLSESVIQKNGTICLLWTLNLQEAM